MKPAPFTYHVPTSIEEALAVLAEVGSAGKVLAGGQSLVPMMSMRLASPAHLIDINRLDELAYVHVEPGAVRVGALARHTDLELDQQVATAQPLLPETIRQVAHPVIRNRGTVVGSLAHADPSAELPALLLLLGGEVELRSVAGHRRVSAAELFVGPLETCLRPDELAVEAIFPTARARTGGAFVEVARRHGDYAVGGVGATVELSADGVVQHARAVYVSVAGTPVCVDLTEALAPSSGRTGSDDWTAVDVAVGDQVRPDGDIHATADYRRHLAIILTHRALSAATSRARGRARAA